MNWSHPWSMAWCYTGNIICSIQHHVPGSTCLPHRCYEIRCCYCSWADVRSTIEHISRSDTSKCNQQCVEHANTCLLPLKMERADYLVSKFQAFSCSQHLWRRISWCLTNLSNQTNCENKTAPVLISREVFYCINFYSGSLTRLTHHIGTEHAHYTDVPFRWW